MTLKLTSVHRLIRSYLIVIQDLMHIVALGSPTFVAKAQTMIGKKLFNDVGITHTECYFSLRNGCNLDHKDRISSTIVPNVRLKRKL